jgi:hypothetical protein
MRVVGKYLTVALLAVTPARAQAIFETGNDLFAKCSAPNSYMRIYCMAYVEGVADALSDDTIAGRRVCIPPDHTVTPAQLQDIAVRYLNGHFETRRRVASNLVAQALHDAFPCPP